MHLQSEKYKQSLVHFEACADKWEKDIEAYQQKIAETEKTGKPVAGMEISLNYQKQRLQSATGTIEDANNYIMALHDEISKLRNSKPGINEDATENNSSTLNKTRLCDLPEKSDYRMLLELREIAYQNSETLNELLQQLTQKKTNA